MVAYVHIEYSTYQFLDESKGGGLNPPPFGPCGTEKSVVLRGLKKANLTKPIFSLHICNMLYSFFLYTETAVWHNIQYCTLVKKMRNKFQQISDESIVLKKQDKYIMHTT